jgi:hypothetical protein
LHIQRPYSEGDVRGVFCRMVKVTKQVVTHYSYAMEVEWPPTMDEKNPPRKIKNYIVDPLRGPLSAISLATPAWFGLHMANDFNWGKKLPSVETHSQTHNFEVDNTLRAVAIKNIGMDEELFLRYNNPKHHDIFNNT